MTKEAEFAGVEALTQELSSATQEIKSAKTTLEEQYRTLTNEFGTVKNSNEELRQQLVEQSKDYAETARKLQALEEGQKETQRLLDSPIYGTNKDLAEHDREMAVEIQRRAHLARGFSEADFKPDMNNLINASDYRSAVRKLMQLGVKTKDEIVRTFSEGEKRAFDAGSLDAGFFAPELLGLTIDDNPECGYLLDLYGQMDVSRSTFAYVKINDYGDLGSYQCDAACDAELGEPGNISYEVGKTHDFRGVFCLSKKVVQEADFSILPFMIRSAARSHRINRNRALLIGDGINEPLGWAHGKGFFDARTTSQTSILTPADIRLFFNSISRSYGDVKGVMHPNVFAYLTSMVDENGRFLFGDGDFLYSPEHIRDFIRLSDCLPDATNKLTVKDGEFEPGAFVMGAANWPTAYYAVNKKPLFIEQWMGQTSAWCAKYQFGAEDGAIQGCKNAGGILKIA